MRNQVNGTETPKTKSGGYIISFQDQNGIGYRGMRMWIVFRFNQILAVLYELHVEFSSCMTLYGWWALDLQPASAEAVRLRDHQVSNKKSAKVLRSLRIGFHQPTLQPRFREINDGRNTLTAAQSSCFHTLPPRQLWSLSEHRHRSAHHAFSASWPE